MAEPGLLERLDAVIRDPRSQDNERAEHAAEVVESWLRRRGLRIAADEVLRELGGRAGRGEQLALGAGRG